MGQPSPKTKQLQAAALPKKKKKKKGFWFLSAALSLSLTHISCCSGANSAGTHHVSRLGFTPLVLLSAVLNGSPGASRLSWTDGQRSPRANLSPKWFVFSSSPVMIWLPCDPALLRALCLIAQSGEFTSGVF